MSPEERMRNIAYMATAGSQIDDAFSARDWAKIAVSEELTEWISNLREAETSSRRLRLRLEAYLNGTVTKCAQCGREIYARAGARFCSDSHRAMYNRK